MRFSKNSKKVVRFDPEQPFAPRFADQPKPMTKSLPDWWRKFSNFFDGETKFNYLGSEGGNLTMKACMPLLDSMTAGYTIPLPCDLQITRDDSGAPLFKWQVEAYDLISSHGEEQVPDAMVPDEYGRKPYKFTNLYSMQTPPGYSLLYCHPINRFDLPFMSLTGIVDIDEYRMPVNFPFLLRKDFEGIIEAGTPMIQIIPIKRESWTHEVSKEFHEKDPERLGTQSMLNTRMWKAYKRYFWHRKDYK